MAGHETFMKAMIKRENLGLGARGRELDRLYKREGRPGSYEDFVAKDANAARWINERMDRMAEMSNARWGEGVIRSKLIEKARPDLPDNLHKPERIALLKASLEQDI